MSGIYRRMLFVNVAIAFLAGVALAGTVAITEDGDIVILKEDQTWSVETPSDKMAEDALNDRRHPLWLHPELVKKTEGVRLGELGDAEAGDLIRGLRREGFERHKRTAERIAGLSDRILAELEDVEVNDGETGEPPLGRLAIDENANLILLMEEMKWRAVAPNPHFSQAFEIARI